MCDCYTAKCNGCGRKMAMHIADYCTPRKNVHPYCPECTNKLTHEEIMKSACFFEDVITSEGEEYGQVDGGKTGETVFILCDDPKAYGIHLN